MKTKIILKDKENNEIEGITVLNKYYQRNCSIWIPAIFALITGGLLTYNYFKIEDFPWYIGIIFWVVIVLSAIITLETLVKVFKFTKFWEINISDKVSALQLLESYQVIEQRGDIFTIIKRTDEMLMLEKFKENYIKPNRKFNIKRKEDKASVKAGE